MGTGGTSAKLFVWAAILFLVGTTIAAVTQRQLTL